ncbi:hypothetical protein GX50_08171 [[Emmonsia] crescens]|uniref:Uncharacterized protein n=1 Tax=[Emmonsia] crescens TaxID=73230 RepID=A0A2B7Z8D6_9EURO|nr:hypothetical protein GX50_08171 [Emmonsia crescens]
MSVDRTGFRNVHFFDALTGRSLGGCFQEGSLTEQNILWILGNILLVVEAPWTVRCRGSGCVIASTNNALAPGDYEIHSTGPLRVSDEPWVARLISRNVSGCESLFTTGVRHRDGRCVISGRINNAARYGIWTAYEAAHVFPIEHENMWIHNNYGRWITDMDDAVGISKINSVQNGLLMDCSLHSLFDQYLFSIDPDDGYKIVSFMPDGFGIDGRILDPVCRDPENLHRVSDEVLRWHFMQSVLANMRGAGEPIFEHDFPPGTDMLGTWREEPYGKERFEMALATKLKPHSGSEPESEP